MRALALALAVLLAGAAHAQPADPVERLADALALTDDQADLVAEVLDPDDPGATWTLAAELLPTLDAAQREALFARPERGARAGAGQGRGARRGARPDRTPDPTRRAVVRAARDAALGLDADAGDRLDAALASLDRRDLMRAVRDGALPEAVAAELDDAQIEVFRAQMALARLTRVRRAR